jgi:hypothetical protein
VRYQDGNAPNGVLLSRFPVLAAAVGKEIIGLVGPGLLSDDLLFDFSEAA